MFVVHSPVEEIIELGNHIYLLKVHSPEIASIIKPGQFLNVRVSDRVYPLLRRPFSVCDVEGEHLYLMFNIMGEGTNILAHKPIGSTLDILGPLGNGYNINGGFETAVIVAGGLGAAPFPYVTRLLRGKKKILSFIGGKTQLDVITHRMEDFHVATEDGSWGLKGTVIDLLKENQNLLNPQKVKMLACGPNPMLKALKDFCLEFDIDCEISTECAMACGFGICQGCPIESTQHPDKYLLVCKDGPVFNVKEVVL